MGKKRSHESPADKIYTSEKRDLKNKAKKIAKHQRRNPNDKQVAGTKAVYKKVTAR